MAILGIRGIPARHGGFETFAERLARHLADKGWQVTVYCQGTPDEYDPNALPPNIRLVHMPTKGDSPLDTIFFDWRSSRHAARNERTVLTLGYNTAVFSFRYRLKGIANLINMDGLEWRRPKWPLPVRVWFYVNERCACWLANHLIADHPEIERRLKRLCRTPVTFIPYGADPVEAADPALLERFGVEPGKYSLIIARTTPDNSTYELVKAFSSKHRNHKLVVIGAMRPGEVAYHRQVRAAANGEVVFPGDIYDPATVRALRYHARLYLHGHRVGGTNPTLVENLAAGTAVLARDNPFNRWVAGPGMQYFRTVEECSEAIDRCLNDDECIAAMREAAVQRHREAFTWDRVLNAYEELLERYQ